MTKVVGRSVSSRGYVGFTTHDHMMKVHALDIWPFILRPSPPPPLRALHTPTALAKDHRLVACYETNKHEDTQHRADKGMSINAG